MRDLLMPSTDAGALMQVVIVLVVTIVGLVVVRRERALVKLVLGLGLVVLGLMGMRTLH